MHQAVADLRAAIADADAVVICTPEYAGALPGALKNLLEWTVGDGGLYGKLVAWLDVAGPAAPTGGADAHASFARVMGQVDAACRQIPVVRSQIGRDGLVADPGIRSALRASTGALVAHVAADSSVQPWPGERRRTTAVPIGERTAAEFAARSPGDDTDSE